MLLSDPLTRGWKQALWFTGNLSALEKSGQLGTPLSVSAPVWELREKNRIHPKCLPLPQFQPSLLRTLHVYYKIQCLQRLGE